MYEKGVVGAIRRGDSNEYTQYTILIVKTKLTLNYLKSAAKCAA